MKRRNVSVKAHSTFTLMGRALPLTRRLKKSSDFVKRATPDGSVMLLTPSSMLSIYPFTYPKLPYNPLTEFAVPNFPGIVGDPSKTYIRGA